MLISSQFSFRLLLTSGITETDFSGVKFNLFLSLIKTDRKQIIALCIQTYKLLLHKYHTL